MSALEVLSPELLPYVLTATTMIGLAAWLVVLDVGSRVNRILAALLLFRGMTFALGAVRIANADHRAGTVAAALGPYAVIPLVPLIVAFLSVYPRPRGVFGTTRWGPWSLAGATLALCGWYLVEHSAFMAVVDGQRVMGPLVLLAGIRLPAFALAAVVLARSYARRPHGSAGYSLFLLAAAFAINALVDGILSVGHLIRDVEEGAAWLPYYWMFSWLPVLALPLAAVALYHFGRVLVLERHDARLNEARRFLLYVVPAAAISAALVSFLPQNDLVVRAGDFVHGFWRLLVPFLITYALLRYSLFSIDIKVKAGVKRAIILTAFGLTFFVVSEAAEALITSGAEENIDADRLFGMSAAAQAKALGISAAVLLVLVSQPLQRGAQRAADALMPDTKPIAAMSLVERQEMYLEQYRLVEHDGKLTAKERRMMDRLGAALGFSEDQAMALEAGEAIDAADVHVARHASAARRASRSVVLATMMAVALAALGSMLEIVFEVGDFVAGLVVAGAITLLLSPFEKLAARITEGPPPRPPEASVSLYEVAVRDALADGHWSRRERLYLDSLAERLGIDRRTRRSLHAQTRQAFVAQNTAGSRYSP